MRRKRAAAILLTVGTVAAVAFAAAGSSSARTEARPGTETPIQHVVVIFPSSTS